MKGHEDAPPRFGATSLWQLAKERISRDGIYHAEHYWEDRAGARDGLARSLWPSNTFNEFWDERQRAVVMRALGDVRGARIVDVGCGTGRMTQFFAANGAGFVTGVDFSKSTVAAAERESRSDANAEARTRFVVGDVVGGLDHVGLGAADIAVVLGCLSVACRDFGELARAIANIAKLVRPGGRVLLLEPIHRSRLLRRVLDLGVPDWVFAAKKAGLALVATDRMGFVPGRMVLSVRDLPRPLVRVLFRAGERALDSAPFLSPLSDYKLLLFDVRSDASASAER